MAMYLREVDCDSREKAGKNLAIFFSESGSGQLAVVSTVFALIARHGGPLGQVPLS